MHQHHHEPHHTFHVSFCYPLQLVRELERQAHHLGLDLDTYLFEVIYRLATHPPITHFKVEVTSMLPIAPGFSPVYTATPSPSNAFPSTPPTWTSSDPVNAPVTADSTGLVGTVEIPATAVVGTSFTLTVSYTNADSTVATGSITQTIVPVPPVDITSFTIKQTS